MQIDLVIPAELNGYVAGSYGAMEFGRQRLKATLEGLTPEQLTQVPAGLNNAIGTLTLHIAAVELSIAYRAKGEPVPDELKAEYLLEKAAGSMLPAAAGETVQSLNAKLDRSRELLNDAMSRLGEADLDRELEFSGGRRPTIRWTLSLLPNHQAQHLGQIQMIKKLLK